jgi:cyclophilin family peptidyl-prolyl cis-trans isomerase
MRRNLFMAAAMGIAAITARPADAGTIVRFTISGVGFDVRLFDETTPSTVQNFLKYVDAGSYVGTVIHRSVPGFIWQGGGFRLDGNPTQAVPIDTFAPVVNEPVYSNVRGTIAMAKIAPFDDFGNPIPGGGPDSATSQWFFNLADNSANLDFQNGGFTVFGEVIDGGMEVVDLIASLPTDNFSGGLGPYGGNFTSTPYYLAGGQPNALIVESIVAVPEPSTLALGLMGLVMCGPCALRIRGRELNILKRCISSRS